MYNKFMNEKLSFQLIVAKALLKLFVDKGMTGVANVEKYIEVILNSSKPLTASDKDWAESELKHNFHIKLLGVSSVESGYRIWGVAFETAKELENYTLQQSMTHGHKEIGHNMQLFEFKEESNGAVFWLERGLQLRASIEEYLLSVIQGDYHLVKTPAVVKKSLWQCSGHLEYFAENMCFVGEDYVLKPMNCPCHMLLYKSKTRSYKELPLRFFEFGEVHRNEPSGALNGLLRLRNFTIDDGHIFCSLDHIDNEVKKFIETTNKVYKDLGFSKIKMYLATRPDKYSGNIEDWDKAEDILKKLNLEELPGEGAFYGPKIEFHIEDAMGRLWQCGTIQIDLVLPVRMGLKYTDSDGTNAVPVVLHRAILGSMERFIATMLEKTQGWLPMWLAPCKIMIIPLRSEHLKRATYLHQESTKLNINSCIASLNQTLGKNIHQAQLERIHKAWIIGDKEIDCITEKDLQTNEQETILDIDLFRNLSTRYFSEYKK